MATIDQHLSVAEAQSSEGAAQAVIMDALERQVMACDPFTREAVAVVFQTYADNVDKIGKAIHKPKGKKEPGHAKDGEEGS